MIGGFTIVKPKMDLELFVLTWGIYPRRILIYLAEKGLLKSPATEVTDSTPLEVQCQTFNLKINPVTVSATETSMELVAPGKPSGTVPILAIGNGTFVKQSIAILEYFEDICEHASLQASEDGREDETYFRTMRGTTPEERARTRDILALADEASTFFGFACHKGSSLFSNLESQSPMASVMALEWCRRALEKIEVVYEDDHRFEVLPGTRNSGNRSNIADCVLFSLLQFSKELYGRDLIIGLPNLEGFYELFKERDSAKIPENWYPAHIESMAKVWLAE